MLALTQEMQELTDWFGSMIESLRRGKLTLPFDGRDSLFRPTFFFEDEVKPHPIAMSNNGKGITYIAAPLDFTMPYEKVWLVGRYGGFLVAAFVSEVQPGTTSHHLVYGGNSPRDPRGLGERMILTMIEKLSHEPLEEFDCEARDSINRGRAMAKNNPLPELPRFIRVGRNRRRTGVATGTGSPKQAHTRRAHKRKLRNGTVIDIPVMHIHGGRDFLARDYIVQG